MGGEQNANRVPLPAVEGGFLSAQALRRGFGNLEPGLQFRVEVPGTPQLFSQGELGGLEVGGAAHSGWPRAVQAAR